MNRLPLIVLLLIVFKAEGQAPSALKIGDSLYALGDYNQALSYYQRLPSSALQQAKTYVAIGNQAKALELYRSALTENPDLTIAKYNLARLLRNSGQFMAADSLLASLEQAYPKHPNYSYQRGLVREQQQDSTAGDFFFQAYVKDSNHLNSIYKLARKNLESRKFMAASNFIEKGLAADGSSARFLTLFALLNFHNENYHQANETYEKLLEMGKSNPQLHENLALGYHRTNRFEEAVDQFAILINQYNDQNARWHFLLAQSYSSLRDYEKAQRHYEIAIVLQRPSVEAEYMGLAYLFGAQKDYQAQLEALRNAIAENPENQRAHYLLATAADMYYKDKNEAIPFYERYLKKFGEKGRFSAYARQRISDLKREIHLSKD